LAGGLKVHWVLILWSKAYLGFDTNNKGGYSCSALGYRCSTLKNLILRLLNEADAVFFAHRHVPKCESIRYIKETVYANAH